MTTTMHRRRRRRRHGPQQPHSILDRAALEAELERGHVPVKAVHLDTFYQAMHRQNYPDLPVFVQTYYQHEAELLLQQQQHQAATAAISNEEAATRQPPSSSSIAISRTSFAKDCASPQPMLSHQEEGDDPATMSTNDNNNDGNSSAPAPVVRPLKNAISARKNKNRQQLPQALLDFLATTPSFVTCTSRVVQARTSANGSTTKMVIQLHDGQQIEAVLMRYDGNTTTTSSRRHRDKNNGRGGGRGRASLCVSSQCGCAMGCTFCATGTMGWSGNLSSAEILEQIVHADRVLEREWGQQNNDGPTELARQQWNVVRNVVFMGMGEPLDNYGNVVTACRALFDPQRWNLAHGRVTVSTVGVLAHMRRLTLELPEVSLALSLHAPTQELRERIVPTARQTPIASLIDAVDAHMMAQIARKKQWSQLLQTARKRPPPLLVRPKNSHEYTHQERLQASGRRRAMIEYVMLDGPTSTLDAAHALGRLCAHRLLVVNLIPYNATNVQDDLKCPSYDHMNTFKNIVCSYGTFCTIRRTMGADIASACGQLITKDDVALDKQESIADNKVPSTTLISTTTNAINNHHDSWIAALSFLTGVAATTFAATVTLYCRQRSRR